MQIEKLLAEIEAMEAHKSPDKAAAGGGGGRSGLDARVRMFERLASEVARLNFYAVRGKVGRTQRAFCCFVTRAPLPLESAPWCARQSLGASSICCAPKLTVFSQVQSD